MTFSRPVVGLTKNVQSIFKTGAAMNTSHFRHPVGNLTTWHWRYGFLLVTAWSWLQGVQAWAQSTVPPSEAIAPARPMPLAAGQYLNAFISSELPPDQQAKQLALLKSKVAATPVRGFLFEVTRGTQRAYIYGTSEWGLPDPAYFPLSTPLLNSLESSAYLLTLVDLDMTPPAQDDVMRLATYPAGDKLEDHLSPALLARLSTRMQAWGRPMPSLSQLKPWFVADLVSSQSLYNNGWRKHVSTENVILGLAHSMGKPIHIAETWKQWAQDLDSMPPALQQGQLSQALRDSEAVQQKDRMSLLFSAWMQSDMPALERYVALLNNTTESPNAAVDGRTNAWISYRQRVFFKQRNQRVIDVMDNLSHEGGPSAIGFVAIPAQYLAGADGLLAQLQARDFNLKEIKPETP
jgi:uncharacterized protein YbaP (TraB family)